MGMAIGTMFVRRSGHIQASAERIWQEFSSLDTLKAWFGVGHTLQRYEPGLNGAIDLSVVVDGEELHFGGPICVFEPGQELSAEINWSGSNAWPAPTYWTIRLTPQYSGTQIEIIHHGFERLGKDAAGALEAYESGWENNHIKALRALVENH